jgi:adenosylcobinamide-GDP ribazoletransferase
MSPAAILRRSWSELLSSVGFLTRIPVPSQPYEADSLPHAVKFFPTVGFLIGTGAALVHYLLVPHLPRPVVALGVLVYLVMVTGCFHEDGLADTADGFGGGWNRDQVLLILRDSRIGSYGATALALSLLARLVLLSTLPMAHIAIYLIAAHVLCRWTTLPLSYWLPSARAQDQGQIHVQSDAEVDGKGDGQGARIARLTSGNALIAGTIFTLAVVVAALRMQSIAPILASVAITSLTGLYYRHRIGGVTGDCFGATNQLAEIAVYLCGVWTV